MQDPAPSARLLVLRRFIGTAPFLLPLLGALLAVSPALAQTPDQRRASEHFDRGIELFNEGRHDAALAEFTAAYEMAPAPGVLYNLGRVHAALGHAVEAVDNYSRYLREGRNLPRGRRAEVERVLEQQRGRVARLTITTNVEGSVVSIDGVDVATTPLDAPIRVTAGRLQVGARAPGHESITISIQVAGRTERTIEIELRREDRPRGSLRVISPVPGVSIVIDGEAVGSTPLDRTIPLQPGAHEVVASRPGYVTQRVRVELEEGAEVDVRLEMGRDPETSRMNLGRLRLHLPNAAYTVRIDGEAAEDAGGTLEVVGGPHSLELLVSEREPFRQSVDVPTGGRLDLTPQLEWTPDARAQRLDEASGQASLGWWFFVPGAIVAAGVGALWFLNEQDIADADDMIARANRVADTECPIVMGPCRDMVLVRELMLTGTGNDRAKIDAFQAEQDDRTLLRWITGPVAVVGLAATTIGLIMVAGAPSEESIDRAAHAASQPRLRFGLGPGAVELAGTF